MTYLGIRNGGEVVDARTHEALLEGALNFSPQPATTVETGVRVGALGLGVRPLFEHYGEPEGYFHVPTLGTTEAEAFGD